MKSLAVIAAMALTLMAAGCVSTTAADWRSEGGNNRKRSQNPIH